MQALTGIFSKCQIANVKEGVEWRRVPNAKRNYHSLGRIKTAALR
jgi:hypothetical protein